MDDQLKDVERGTTADDHKPTTDLLRRVFIPIERRTVKGTFVFKTMDGELYVRLDDGSIRRARPKINGKQARKARRACRP
jgi:hypothetical protein